MSFSLWTNDVCLGSLELARQEHAAHILHGHFAPDEPHAVHVREAAVAVPCVGPWMLRDARQSNGVAAVNPLMVGTEFFALIADRVEVQSRRLALELRDADGDVVPTALIVVQGTHFGMDWIPLYRRATADWDARVGAFTELQREAARIQPFSVEDLQVFLASNASTRTFKQPITIISVDLDDEGRTVTTTRTFLKPSPVPPFVVHVRLIDAASVQDDELHEIELEADEETVEIRPAEDPLGLGDGDAWRGTC